MVGRRKRNHRLPLVRPKAATASDLLGASGTLTVKAEGSIVIILNDEGRELDREDFGDYYEADHAGILADIIDAQIPWRDLQKEADEAYREWLIARAEDMEAA